MEAVKLLLQVMFFFSSIWFCLSLFQAYREAPSSWRGALTHDGPVFVRQRGWWVRESVIFSGCTVAAIAAFLFGVAL